MKMVRGLRGPCQWLVSSLCGKTSSLTARVKRLSVITLRRAVTMTAAHSSNMKSNINTVIHYKVM